MAALITQQGMFAFLFSNGRHYWLRPLAVLFLVCGSQWAVNAQPKPVIVSNSTSTRALAFDAVRFTTEPFSAAPLPYLYASDNRTRVMLFVMNLSLASGEGPSALTADAEDAAHRHYNLSVEYVGNVAGMSFVKQINLRLDEAMGDVGDVLIKISYHGVDSNRVRVGIGHVGGGLSDDSGAVPTPAPIAVLSGRLTIGTAPLDGVTLTFSGEQTQTVVADNAGNYSTLITSPGTFTITPSRPYVSFSPSSKVLSNLTGNQTADFFATVNRSTISGVLKDEAGNALEGFTVALTNSNINLPPLYATTSTGGNFSFTGLLQGDTYTLTPLNTSVFTFNPLPTGVLGGDFNTTFNATRRNYRISGVSLGFGNVPSPGVSVNLSGYLNLSTVTDGDGRYSFENLPAGRTYQLVASKLDHQITPGLLSWVLTSDENINFGALRLYQITGLVKDDAGNQLDGIAVALGSSNKPPIHATTNIDGKVFFTGVLQGETYTLTPLQTSLFSFNPVNTGVLGNDFTATFNATRRNYRISGLALGFGNSSNAGVTMTLTGYLNLSTVTDANGSYSFDNLPAGRTYQLSAAKLDHQVNTAPQTYTLLKDEATNFSVIRQYRITGRVADTTGKGIFGSIVKLTGPETLSMYTPVNGEYSFTVTTPGNYVLTPTRWQDFYQFSPPNRSFTNLSDHQLTNFTATLTVPSPFHVLEFDGTPMSVDHGIYWPQAASVGHFFWEFWAMPGTNTTNTYLISDGYGGAHALLFGFTYGSRGYNLFGNIWDGSQTVYFNSDDGPAAGEWGHYSVGWDGQNIIMYYNGVPVGKTPFTGPRISVGAGQGTSMVLVGGSTHQNLNGRIAQLRAFEENNPRESSPESTFVPETVFSPDGQLMSRYFTPADRMADLSNGYNGSLHDGWPRGMLEFYFNYSCNGCPVPRFVIDPTAPNFANAANPGQIIIPPLTPPSTPSGALVFDSFTRNNATYILNGLGGLGTTETGSAGVKTWQTSVDASLRQPFGILSGRAVPLANDQALTWISTGAGNGDLSISVERNPGPSNAGLDTGLSFRVIDANNFFFAYTSMDTLNPSGPRKLTLGYFLGGVKTVLASNVAMPASNWKTLRVVTTETGNIDVYGDNALVYSTSSTVNATATGAGLFNNAANMGLSNRWDNFTVLTAP